MHVGTGPLDQRSAIQLALELLGLFGGRLGIDRDQIPGIEIRDGLAASIADWKKNSLIRLPNLVTFDDEHA
jgi:hypothetical protein